ncbi:MAG: OmpA family protein [Bacteroidia bacterium]|nr:OmpA family protein [Bacteroidia bacterium]
MFFRKVLWFVIFAVQGIVSIAQTYSVSTFVGSRTKGFSDGPGGIARFGFPNGICVDINNNVYVSDDYANAIRKVTPSGLVVTLAGNGMAGYADGNSSQAQFNNPIGMCSAKNGDLYVADHFNHCVRKIDSTGKVTTVAGIPGKSGYVDGPGNAAMLSSPMACTIDQAGNVYVIETGNHAIRKITPAGMVSTLAGNGTSGFQDGIGKSASFNSPIAICIDKSQKLYVIDSRNRAVRQVGLNGKVTTVVLPNFEGLKDSTNGLVNLNFANSEGSFGGGVAADPEGNIYIADAGSSSIICVNIYKKVVSVVAGTGMPGWNDGDGNEAAFNEPVDICLDKKGNLYVTDKKNYCIRKIIINKRPAKPDTPPQQFILRGRVYDKASNKPIPTEFKINDLIREKTISTNSSSTGNYNTPLLRGQYQIIVDNDNYLPFETYISIPKLEANDYVLDVPLNKITEHAKIILEDINFEPTSAKLTEQSLIALSRIALYLKVHAGLIIQINGHTDRGGSAEHNLKLSEDRARTVKDKLIDEGVNPNQLKYKGFGGTKPIADNNTPEGRMKNRRTEFEIIAK